jgi:hypothetical protein
VYESIFTRLLALKGNSKVKQNRSLGEANIITVDF